MLILITPHLTYYFHFCHSRNIVCVKILGHEIRSWTCLSRTENHSAWRNSFSGRMSSCMRIHPWMHQLYNNTFIVWWLRLWGQWWRGHFSWRRCQRQLLLVWAVLIIHTALQLIPMIAMYFIPLVLSSCCVASSEHTCIFPTMWTSDLFCILVWRSVLIILIYNQSFWLTKQQCLYTLINWSSLGSSFPCRIAYFGASDTFVYMVLYKPAQLLLSTSSLSSTRESALLW